MLFTAALVPRTESAMEIDEQKLTEREQRYLEHVRQAKERGISLTEVLRGARHQAAGTVFHAQGHGSQGHAAASSAIVSRWSRYQKEEGAIEVCRGTCNVGISVITRGRCSAMPGPPSERLRARARAVARGGVDE